MFILFFREISVYKLKSFYIMTIATILGAQSIFANTEQINQRIKSLPNELKPEFIDKTPISNLYTLSNIRGSVLIDASGRYLIYGDVIDLENMQNIADYNYQKHYAINPKQLPTANALKEVKGNGQRVLYVFADPDCPACQALQGILENVDNITIYTFPMGLAHLHPTAIETSKNIWCSKDPVKAWKAYLLDGDKPNKRENSCHQPIDQNMAITKKYRINLTPTIFNSQGHRVVGVPELEGLENFINTADHE
ncbi:DsbC family protein [Acinetobacter gyllenbergii]|uniref:DsbC family protein n=1 Tax=Acinetobacter gyllenbergii TaxID=134534 RepID=UPI003F5667C0